MDHLNEWTKKEIGTIDPKKITGTNMYDYIKNDVESYTGFEMESIKSISVVLLETRYETELCLECVTIDRGFENTHTIPLVIV